MASTMPATAGKMPALRKLYDSQHVGDMMRSRKGSASMLLAQAGMLPANCLC